MLTITSKTKMNNSDIAIIKTIGTFPFSNMISYKCWKVKDKNTHFNIEKLKILSHEREYGIKKDVKENDYLVLVDDINTRNHYYFGIEGGSFEKSFNIIHQDIN
jgi:hypothetical protein